ncbi:sirohydrochlorin cobaltochelatase [Desulfoprunum benzoelyticum]|uniref:Sirohydrochlorin cobaltochelatase n=1 Tax=Desulfoprunum benzoelyticum TaxID=1506996 RepID=A0A840UXW5_9BACT|nr:sirohydrochlorin cobaltochelatase [Desulfoprunum benzoelyticum]MBB5346340.1 sirohydrochlorin cobaltochelatase [Desulfoprunum benzoelyticum]MBM9528661.1 sirohydrochlorin cobaltochelatase [Desulfoprunum benzoelyticum]
MHSFIHSVCALFLLFLLCQPAQAGDNPDADRQAVVLAAFGTTVPKALPGILNIRDRLQRQYPQTPVKIAFTSNIIRRIWQGRRGDAAFITANPSVPADVYTVQGPLATIANLQDQGYRTIIVQPGHISAGEEYLDLVAAIDGLNSIRTIKPKFRPFEKLAVGRPAMGTAGEQHPYSEDLALIARALADDAVQAEKANAALLYMAHGNTYMPSGSAYLEFASIMNRLYPQVKTYIALVEGYPSLDDTLPLLEHAGVSKLLLKPFMTVAGDHTVNDMAGDEPEAWKSILSAKGYEVMTVAKGLGEIDAFADVYLHHLQQTATDHGIVLH